MRSPAGFLLVILGCFQITVPSVVMERQRGDKGYVAEPFVLIANVLSQSSCRVRDRMGDPAYDRFFVVMDLQLGFENASNRLVAMSDECVEVASVVPYVIPKVGPMIARPDRDGMFRSVPARGCKYRPEERYSLMFPGDTYLRTLQAAFEIAEWDFQRSSRLTTENPVYGFKVDIHVWWEIAGQDQLWNAVINRPGYSRSRSVRSQISYVRIAGKKPLQECDSGVW